MATKLAEPAATPRFLRVAHLSELRAECCLPVQIESHSIALFLHDGKVFAVDNRCPHMGFPLHRGTVKDGILTCHWHHARFDLASGGTFDQWADDVRAYPVQVRGDEVWVDIAPQADFVAHQRQRLHDGLERNIPLVIAKAVISLYESRVEPAEPFRVGLKFGTHYRRAGWGAGLTIHTCMMNLLPSLDSGDRARALHHGLSAVAQDVAGSAPSFELHPLPGGGDFEKLQRWFRQFVEVRDAEGAERCIVSAVRAGADDKQMSRMLFAAATDHRYIDTGHPLDFTNKAFEALDHAGWELAAPVLGSLAVGYAMAERMEESNAWRHPVDLVKILDRAFEQLPGAIDAGRSATRPHPDEPSLLAILLGEDPAATAEALLESLRAGVTPLDLAGVVTHAAALRVARFHTSNEFPDWDTAHHTFTFANAVQQGLRRTDSPELVRGIFDAAMSVYLDRFLNVPPAPLPDGYDIIKNPEVLLEELPRLLDQQQRVNEAGHLVGAYLASRGDAARLVAALCSALLREDRNFHAIQSVEAAVTQHAISPGTPAANHALIAAARYLAAHAPTVRAQGQTFQVAERLSRGERIFEA